jgi:hypothetical protein
MKCREAGDANAGRGIQFADGGEQRAGSVAEVAAEGDVGSRHWKKVLSGGTREAGLY